MSAFWSTALNVALFVVCLPAIYYVIFTTIRGDYMDGKGGS